MDCGSCKLPELASISLDLTIFDDGVFDCEGCAIGVCGLYDADLNEGLLDPFDLCADFFFSDGTSLLGVPFAACYDHCFETAGVHEICMEVYCCDNPDERIVLCESLSCGCPVECSVGNAFWAVGQTANDGECQVQFEGIEFLGPGTGYVRVRAEAASGSGQKLIVGLDRKPPWPRTDRFFPARPGLARPGQLGRPAGNSFRC